MVIYACLNHDDAPPASLQRPTTAEQSVNNWSRQFLLFTNSVEWTTLLQTRIFCDNTLRRCCDFRNATAAAAAAAC